MKKIEYYLNTISGKKNGEYPKVSGYVEAISDSKATGILLIGYDQRGKDCWMATELSSGLGVSQYVFSTRKECMDEVHKNIDVIMDKYNAIMTDEKSYQGRIKSFVDFVNANGGI